MKLEVILKNAWRSRQPLSVRQLLELTTDASTGIQQFCLIDNYCIHYVVMMPVETVWNLCLGLWKTRQAKR